MEYGICLLVDYHHSFPNKQPDPICPRILMQMCNVYQRASLAVRLMNTLRMFNYPVDVVTTAAYNQVLLRWNSDRPINRWRKLRHVLNAISYLNKSVKARHEPRQGYSFLKTIMNLKLPTTNFPSFDRFLNSDNYESTSSSVDDKSRLDLFGDGYRHILLVAYRCQAGILMSTFKPLSIERGFLSYITDTKVVDSNQELVNVRKEELYGQRLHPVKSHPLLVESNEQEKKKKILDERDFIPFASHRHELERKKKIDNSKCLNFKWKTSSRKTDPCVAITSCSKCSVCSCYLFDEEITAAWALNDSELRVRCVYCSALIVPSLSVYTRINEKSQKWIESAVSRLLEYLSPMALRKEIEYVIEQNLGVSGLRFRHPSVYWNILWHFSRLALKSHVFTSLSSLFVQTKWMHSANHHFCIERPFCVLYSVLNKSTLVDALITCDCLRYARRIASAALNRDITLALDLLQSRRRHCACSFRRIRAASTYALTVYKQILSIQISLEGFKESHNTIQDFNRRYTEAVHRLSSCIIEESREMFSARTSPGFVYGPSFTDRMIACHKAYGPLGI
ncbi:hypothetical protein ACOME3_006833 [Neoechinorhynchus agilis]